MSLQTKDLRREAWIPRFNTVTYFGGKVFNFREENSPVIISQLSKIHPDAFFFTIGSPHTFFFSGTDCLFLERGMPQFSPAVLSPLLGAADW